MAAIYDNLGVRFLYPENWQVVDEQANEWPRAVTLESPSGAFWSLQVHAPPSDLSELLDAGLAVLRQEYEQLEVAHVQEVISELPVVGLDITFFYLDLIVQVRMRAFTLGVRNCLVLYQAEDADFELLGRVFEAITTSLIREATLA